MKRACVSVIVLALCCWLAGCNQSTSSAPAPATANTSQAAPAAATPAPATAAPESASAGTAPNNQVTQKLQELAGKNATNCGRLGLNVDSQAAADCAMKANKAKLPFYVAYDMPGLTVGVAGAANGKLYAVQAESAKGGGAPGKVSAADCPSALRVAQSGRVTCTPPGSMGTPSTGGSNPHAGVTMPPAAKGNAHGGMAVPPAGTPNPHQGGAPMEGAKSH